MLGGLFKGKEKQCECCELYKGQIADLKLMLNGFFERMDMPILESGEIKEDFTDDAEPTLNKEGFAPAEVHDD